MIGGTLILLFLAISSPSQSLSSRENPALYDEHSLDYGGMQRDERLYAIQNFYDVHQERMASNKLLMNDQSSLAYNEKFEATRLFEDNFYNERKLLKNNLRPTRHLVALASDKFFGNNATTVGEKEKKGKNERQKRNQDKRRRRSNISLWIDEQQVRMFSGFPMEIYVIVEGRVMPYILDPDFESQLPIIPSEVKTVNFTWKSGEKKYIYNFELLRSIETDILQHPYVSIKRRGRVPKKPKSFSVHIPCVGNVSGVATFDISLVIQNTKGEPLPDTPIHIRLRKMCEILGEVASQSCDEKCSNGGICDTQKRCLCKEGYMGILCQTALCYPQCRNGGTCSSPGRCSCPSGYHGRYCEGGICNRKCLSGGKCIQKDTCACRKGFYGNRCEFSKCIIPCVNGGKCQGVNKCRCKSGYSGNHCEIINAKGLAQLMRRCSTKCRHGECVEQGTCICQIEYGGRWCRTRLSNKKQKSSTKKKLWV